jgi:hypothetical protein
VVEQRGLAGACLTAQDEHARTAVAGAVDNLAEPRALVRTADKLVHAGNRTRR